MTKTDQASTFKMNYTAGSPTDSAVPGLPVDSAVVELEHWFSIEDLAYMHNIGHRSQLPTETRPFGVFNPIPVAQ